MASPALLYYHVGWFMNMKTYLLPRAFVLLELLLVVVIIAILAGAYFNRNNNPGDPRSTYQMSMGKANDAACKANRAVLRNSIEMFRMQHPGEPVTTENLQKTGVNPPSCPQGGVYGFTKEGTIICSKHPEQ
jgi:prepilin-type N-terminal cleavage/methylation domain-containing protein